MGYWKWLRKGIYNYLNSIDPVFVYMCGITIIWFTSYWLFCEIFLNMFFFHNPEHTFISLFLWLSIMILFLSYMIYLEDKKGEK